MSLRDNQTISRQKALALSLRRHNDHIAATAKMAVLIVAALPIQIVALQTTLTKGSHPSLPYNQMPTFMSELRRRDAVAARALEFLILTNVRTDAVLKATWDQIDFENALWTVPLASLKDRKHRKEPFRVPLPPRATEIVREIEMARVSSYVFPGQLQGRPFSNMAFLTLLKRMNGVEKKWVDATTGKPITAHGFRATFRTWAEEVATVPHAVIEQAMGHQVGSRVERSYRRTDILEKRRKLMDVWAAFCSTLSSDKVANVIALRGKSP